MGLPEPHPFLSYMQMYSDNLGTVIDVNERRLIKHRPVARVLREGVQAQEVVDLALAQVQLWEQKHLCSQDYIDEWKNLLKQPQQAAKVLEERSARAAALRQNSPFVASVRKFQSLAYAA